MCCISITVANLLLGGLTNLSLGGTTNLLHSVATFLALFAGLFLDFYKTVTLQAVFGFEFLGEIQSVVDQSEASGAATTESCTETEDKAYIRGYFVHGSEFLADFGFVDGSQAWVDDIAYHLLSAKQTVGHEFAGANSGGGTGHDKLLKQK